MIQPNLEKLCTKLLMFEAHIASTNESPYFSIHVDEAKALLAELATWRKDAHSFVSFVSTLNPHAPLHGEVAVRWGNKSVAHTRVLGMLADAILETQRTRALDVGDLEPPRGALSYLTKAVIAALREELGDRWNPIETEARRLHDENVQLRAWLERVQAHANAAQRRLAALSTDAPAQRPGG